jgi:integrase
MQVLDPNSAVTNPAARCSLGGEASSASHEREDFSAMARRRYQDPKPERRGNWWTVRIWKDKFQNGVRTRYQQRVKLCDANQNQREAARLASELIRPLNQGLISIGGGVNFMRYVENNYTTGTLPRLASTTQEAYQAAIRNHLTPKMGRLSLADVSKPLLKNFFAGLAQEVNYPTVIKVRDSLSSILRSAVEDELLVKNPLDGLTLPKDKRPRKTKPTLSPEQFNNLLQLVAEPYATMLYVAVWTGLRVSELIGLKWRCVHSDSITIEERYTRGDWSVPKTQASAATIGVSPEVIVRLLHLKSLTVDVRAGRAIRKYKLVKSADPDALVFQSVKDGKPMNDQNVLKRHIQPAAEKLGLPFVTWRCLRTSHATWLVQAGADPKSVQAQMRHSRISTTMDIYAQVVPAAQRKALEKLTEFAGHNSGLVMVTKNLVN